MIPTPPSVRKAPQRIEQLDRVRTDDYAWMKDANWQQVLHDPAALRADIRAHLEAENAYTAAVLADTEALQQQIIAEIKGRMKPDEASLPSPDGPWEYYALYEPGAQYPVHARRPRGRADGEQVLIDAAALAEGHPYYALAAARHSPDHRLFAYAEDTQGSEVYRIRIKDLATGALLPPRGRALHRQLRLVRRQRVAVLDLPRRARPPVAHLPPPGAGRAGG